MGLSVYKENQVHERAYAGDGAGPALTRVVDEARQGDVLYGVHYHADTMFNVAQLTQVGTEMTAILARCPELAPDIALLRELFDEVERNRGYLWIAGD